MGQAYGYLATCCEISLAFPQIFKIWRNKTAKGVSKKMIAIWLCSDVYKTIYFISNVFLILFRPNLCSLQQQDAFKLLLILFLASKCGSIARTQVKKVSNYDPLFILSLICYFYQTKFKIFIYMLSNCSFDLFIMPMINCKKNNLILESKLMY